MTKPYCVGLMGQLASGKSTAARCFEALGVMVISADQIARALTQKGSPALATIVERCGKDILTDTAELDRARLRTLIFNNKELRLWLEALLHPLIRTHIERDIQAAKTPYCLIEIPLLTDRSNYPYLNRILHIQASPAQQLERVMQRDQCSKTEALHILAVQQNHLYPVADDLIVNTSSVEALEQRVQSLHEEYLRAGCYKN